MALFKVSRRTALIANTLAGLVLVAMAVALWREPVLLIRLDFAKQRVLLGAESREVEVDGHRVVYAELPADRPDAPTLVLLHGYTGSKENWYRTARGLKGRYRILMPDLPGWGESERVPGANYGMPAQAARVAEFIRKTNGGRPVALAGHSMGGGIAALVAARQPALVSQVALLNAAGVRFADNAFGKAVLAGQNPFEVRDPESLERFLATVFGDRATRPWLPWPADRAYIAFRRSEAPFEDSVLARIGRSEERFLPGEEAARIHQPALLLWCDGDRVIDPSALALYAARIPQASQVMLEGCGHMSMMERPGDTVVALILLIDRGAPR